MGTYADHGRIIEGLTAIVGAAHDAWAVDESAKERYLLVAGDRETVRTSTNTPTPAVWETLTAPELVKRWQYGSDLVTDWAVGSPIRFTVQWDGGGFEQWGTVLDFDRPRQLSCSLFAPRPDLADLPKEYFTMTYLLTPLDGGGTRVSITPHDPCPVVGEVEADGEAENPVLIELRTVAESLARLASEVRRWTCRDLARVRHRRGWRRLALVVVADRNGAMSPVMAPSGAQRPGREPASW